MDDHIFLLLFLCSMMATRSRHATESENGTDDSGKWILFLDTIPS